MSGALVREVGRVAGVLARPQLLVEVETTIGDVPGTQPHAVAGYRPGRDGRGHGGRGPLRLRPGLPIFGAVGARPPGRAAPAASAFPGPSRHRRPATVGRSHGRGRVRGPRPSGDIAAGQGPLGGRHGRGGGEHAGEPPSHTWRAISLWRDDRPRSTSLTVVDAIDAGYWRSSVPEKADFEDPALEVTLQPVSSGEVCVIRRCGAARSAGRGDGRGAGWPGQRPAPPPARPPASAPPRTGFSITTVDDEIPVAPPRPGTDHWRRPGVPECDGLRGHCGAGGRSLRLRSPLLVLATMW